MQDTQKNLYKKLLGRKGEDLAVRFLKKLGYKIVERNYRTKTGEADIIAKDGNVLVFIEVKTRTNDTYGTPAEAVGYTRQRRYVAVATEYTCINKATDVDVRFDVVEVTNEGVNHIVNAFTA